MSCATQLAFRYARRSVGKNHNLTTVNRSFQNAAKFKYDTDNRNRIQEELWAVYSCGLLAAKWSGIFSTLVSYLNTKKFKNLRNYNFRCSCVEVWNLVSHNRTETDWGRHNTGCSARYLDVRERKYQENGENRTFRSFMTGIPLRMWPNYWAWDAAHVAPMVQKLKVWRGANRNTGVKWFLQKVRIGFKCLRTGTRGGSFFRTQYWTFRLNKMCARFAWESTCSWRHTISDDFSL